MKWKGKRIQVKEGWHEFGKTGIALGEPVFVEQDWLPLKWDDEDDPTFNKLAGIELKKRK